MNLTRAQKVRLGTFMVTGLTFFVGAVVVLTGLQILEQRDVYYVNFTGNVSGLEPSAPVKYQGLRVGRVDAMRISPDDPGAIEVTLSLEPDTVLHVGAKAVLDASGLTGLKTINLTAGDPRQGVLEVGSRLPAEESFVDKITGQAEAIAVKVELAANNLVKWTEDENRERVERLVDSITALAEEIDLFLETNRGAFNNALVGVGKASTSFAGVANEAERSIAMVRQDVNVTLGEARTTLEVYRAPLEKVEADEVAAALSSARSAFDTLGTRLGEEQLGKAIVELNTALADLTRLLRNTDLVVRAGREDFTATLKYVRQAAEDLREFSRIIAQNPAALLSGRE